MAFRGTAKSDTGPIRHNKESGILEVTIRSCVRAALATARRTFQPDYTMSSPVLPVTTFWRLAGMSYLQVCVSQPAQNQVNAAKVV
jgi:hypothetical protein